MQFEFSTAGKIVFGPGKISALPGLAKEFGARFLIVSGAPIQIENQLQEILRIFQANIPVIKVDSEPTIDFIRYSLQTASQHAPDVIIGIGGGSAIDTAKVISALLTNPGDITDYLEVIGQGKLLIKPSLPLIAIPTTAGTGSEVTRNAVIGSTIMNVKVSLRSQFLLPRISIVDPELTVSLPPSVTALTGLDALTQLIEPFTSNSANPLTDSLCVEGIQRIGRAIYAAYDTGTDLSAREDMSLAALFSGISLANAKLGAVHGFAGVIGGETHANHGAICASLLANVIEENISAIEQRVPGNRVLERYALIGRLLTGNTSADASDGIDWIRTFCQHSQIKSLSKLGLSRAQFPEIIEKAQNASSMKGNPIILTQDELRTILEKSL